MLGAHAPLLITAVAVLLVGCASPAEPAGSSAAAAESTPTPTATVVGSVQPEPLLDLDCADFSAVATFGTIAGVTERDPRAVTADLFDPASLADVVRNAGGLACEFSDGGVWRLEDADGLSLNESWHGAAIFVVPNGATAVSDVKPSGECGDSTTSGIRSVCVGHLVAGTTWITIVVSTNDRGQTFNTVRDHVAGVVSQAAATTTTVPRAAGTFDPPHDCATLIPTSTVGAILGAADVTADRALENEAAAQATYYTEHIGCEWWLDSLPRAVEAIVYPGGGWAAALTLPELTGTELDLAELHDGDEALTHCTDVSEWGYWLCTAEVVADGTWLRATGNAPDAATASAIATATVQAMLTHRD